MKVNDILKIKGEALFTAAPQTSLRDAVATMAQHDIGSLVIMENGAYVGILTFRETLAVVNANNGSCGQATIASAVRKNAPSCAPEDDISALRELMIGSHARYLPVLKDGSLLGVLSFYDVAKAVLEEQHFENKMLKSYINDWPQEGAPSESVIKAPSQKSEKELA